MPIFMDPEQKTKIEAFFQQYPLMKFERGEKIIRPNELESSIVYIKSGFLKISHVSHNGKEVIINILNSSKYSCLVLGIATYITRYSLEALNEVKVIRAPRDAFLDFINENPQSLTTLLQPLSRSLQSIYYQTEWLKSGNAYYKIASVIHSLGKETGDTNKKTVTIGFRLTHQMIANLTGLTRETVTVQLNRLRDKGFIDYEDNILTINNVPELSHLIELES